MNENWILTECHISWKKRKLTQLILKCNFNVKDKEKKKERQDSLGFHPSTQKPSVSVGYICENIATVLWGTGVTFMCK